MRTPLHLLIAGVVLLGATGCSGEKPEPKLPLSQAQKKFEEKCREDFEMHVSTRMVGETLWIYLPTKEPIFDYESQKETSATAKKPSKFVVQYVDGDFKNGRFAFEYDIVTRKKAKAEDYGYNSSYTDSYIKQQNNLFTAISDVYFNTTPVKGEDHIKFIVITITDIKKGIETKSTLYFEDFKRFMTGDLPYEEYMKRYLADTKGSQSMIGDETGSHIKYSDVKMPDFLTKQMINRINFKFQHSDFAPPDDYDKTIAGIVADTTRYYKFGTYTGVNLHNLRLNKKFVIEKDKMAKFYEDLEQKEPSKDKLIHIRFDSGQAEFDEQPWDAPTGPEDHTNTVDQHNQQVTP